MILLSRARKDTPSAPPRAYHNTPHLERHLYTLRPASTEGPFTASMDKGFYVSPFIDMEGRYSVHVSDDPSGLRIAINERRDDQPVISTSLVLERRRLSNRAILRLLVTRPLMTQRTMALIHVHAWRLWRRGAKFHRHGAAVAEFAARRAEEARQMSAQSMPSTPQAPAQVAP